MDIAARLEVVENENEILRERIRQLEHALFTSEISIPFEWKLTASEYRVFAFLLTKQVATKEALMSAMYTFRPDSEEPDAKIIDVFICKMRKKLKPFDVEIRTHWGSGYSVDDATRAKFGKRSS
ncbi:MAG: helix-turn-helix domain-containing protein [Hyphomicrobiales bacterium]|nr:helix-turn-helix domain-containing protein [Hyphomicrobiales bacterium]